MFDLFCWQCSFCWWKWMKMDWTPEFSRSFQSLRAAAKRKMMTSKASRRNYRHLDYRDTIEILWDPMGSIWIDRVWAVDIVVPMDEAGTKSAGAPGASSRSKSLQSHNWKRKIIRCDKVPLSGTSFVPNIPKPDCPLPWETELLSRRED